MSLQTTRAVLEAAAVRGVAAAAFNVVQIEHAQGIAEAAEAAGEPVILQLSENTISYHGGPRAITRAVKEVAESAAVPIALHLDHATGFELCARAADLGFSSFMIDASALAYDRNVQLTAKAVAMASSDGLWVEAELGEVGGKNAHQTGARTSPDEAAAFADATGVHGLAIAIGSSHAMSEKTATLDLELLDSIAAEVAVPLVLHGSSGVRESDLVDATRRGIRKVNIGTQLNLAFTRAVRHALAEHPRSLDPRGYLGAGRTAVARQVEQVLHLLTTGSPA